MLVGLIEPALAAAVLAELARQLFRARVEMGVRPWSCRFCMAGWAALPMTAQAIPHELGPANLATLLLAWLSTWAAAWLILLVAARAEGAGTPPPPPPPPELPG